MAFAELWMSGDLDDLDPLAPPTNINEYAKKPLPALPSRARSVASSVTSDLSQAFTSDVSRALSSSKSSNRDGSFLFDWEVESSARSVRLHQSLGPDDMIPLRLRSRKYFFSTLSSDLTTLSKPTSSVSSGTWTSTAGVERRIAQATAGPDPRPPFVHRHTLPAALSIISPPTVPPDEVLSPQTRLSVQKILKLTGNMSPTTTLSTDTPSLHNSTQKIRQLTGLDYGPRRDSEFQLQTLEEEEMSDLSSESGFSLYCHEIVEEPVYDEPAESTCSQSYVESIHELITPLAAAPRYITSAPPPAQDDPLPEEEDPRIVVKEALQLSGFNAAAVGVSSPEERTPNTGRPESWDAYSEGEGLHSSSSSEISESEFEMEPTAAELYHDSAVAIARSSPLWSPVGKGDVGDTLSPIPKHMGWDSKHQTSDTTFTTGSRGSMQDSIGSTNESTLSRSSSVSRSFALNRFRKKDNLSGRPGRIPSPLEAVSPSSTSSWGKQAQGTPYPPVSSSIRATVEEAEDGQARLSLLARIFTNGSSSSLSVSKRDSVASSGSGRTPSLMSARLADRTTPTTSSWSPDTPSPGTVTFADASRSSAGLLARTMEHARNATVRKSKIDKAEARRGSLRGKIKVLRDGDDSTIDLEKFSRPGFRE